MTGEALKRIAVAARAGDEPSVAEQGAALGEAIDLLVGFAADLKRIADSLATLAETVDDNCQPAVVVKAFVEPSPPPPSDD